jgi:hypothetical protein
MALGRKEPRWKLFEDLRLRVIVKQDCLMFPSPDPTHVPVGFDAGIIA